MYLECTICKTEIDKATQSYFVKQKLDNTGRDISEIPFCNRECLSKYELQERKIVGS